MVVSQGAWKLTAKDVETAKPDAAKTRILADGNGLRLLIKPQGQKYWQFRTAKGGKETTLQLGAYPTVSLKRARELAEGIRRQQAEGLNPVLERKQQKVRRLINDNHTFASVCEEFLEVKIKNGISPSYLKKIKSLIAANLEGKLGALPIQTIDAPLLKQTLKPIELRGSLELLDVVRRIAGEIFDLAKANGVYVGDNPSHVLKKNVFAKHKRGERQALAWDDMNGFLHRLDGGRGEFATMCAIRLLMLTACRPGEVRAAEWSEFDLDGQSWTIPASRMKARKEHKVPLANQAVVLLRQLKLITGDGTYLFPASRGAKSRTLTDMAVLSAVRRVAGHKNVDAHGFRATFRTHAEESGLWRFEVMEAALAHGKANQVVAAYDRSTHYPQRKKLAQWYADELDAAKRGGKK